MERLDQLSLREPADAIEPVTVIGHKYIQKYFRHKNVLLSHIAQELISQVPNIHELLSQLGFLNESDKELIIRRLKNSHFQTNHELPYLNQTDERTSRPIFRTRRNHIIPQVELGKVELKTICFSDASNENLLSELKPVNTVFETYSVLPVLVVATYPYIAVGVNNGIDRLDATMYHAFYLTIINSQPELARIDSRINRIWSEKSKNAIGIRIRRPDVQKITALIQQIF